MTGAERTKQLYDEMERLARSLVDCFDTDRGFDKLGVDEAPLVGGVGSKSRMLDPEILFGRVAALDDVAQEWRALKKFRGSLQVVRD
jgi:hypothetical protein